MAKSLPSHSQRLAELVHRQGGITANEAVKAAEVRLDTIRDSSLQELAATVDQMVAIGEELANSTGSSAFQALYAISNTVVGVAGVFGMPELGQVAFSLCTLLDRQRSAATCNTQAILLHLSSLRVMFAGEDNELKRALIDALHQVVDRVSRQAPSDHGAPSQSSGD